MYRDLREFIAGSRSSVRCDTSRAPIRISRSAGSPRSRPGCRNARRCCSTTSRDFPRLPHLHQCHDHSAAGRAGARARSRSSADRRAEGLDGQTPDADAPRAGDGKHRDVPGEHDSGDAVDLGTFPVPVWHRKDGGPYIGSGSIVVMRDPDSGWINASIYRVQVHGRNRVDRPVRPSGPPRRHHREEILGPGPALPDRGGQWRGPGAFHRGLRISAGRASEYAFAGAIKDAPIEVFAGRVTGLPLPAHAEIIFEGELHRRWAKYPARRSVRRVHRLLRSRQAAASVMEVMRSLPQRSDPARLAAAEAAALPFRLAVPRRQHLEQSGTAGITDVVGVWQHVSQLMTVVAIEAALCGPRQARRADCRGQSYMGRLVVVVDDDVDPSNLNDVMWAITTRCEPSE